MKSRRPLEERFWEKVQKGEGCWAWTGATVYGYGRIGAGGTYGPALMAHRVSWELHNGPIPEGMNVLHRCDNPPCTNPEHLFLGTHADNVADKVAKGRGASRQRHGMAKLTEDQVARIRLMVELGEQQRVVANLFGVSESQISMIVNGRRWAA
jgi:hypothetical protein